MKEIKKDDEIIIHEDMKMKKMNNWILFKSFLIAGLFTFTGGIGMLSALRKSIVDRYLLISKEEFYDCATMAQAVPGMIGLNFALLVGKKVNGNTGLILTTIATIFPAFILMLGATILAQFIPQQGPIQYALVGVRAASTSAVFMAAYSLGKYLVKNRIHWLMIIFSFITVGILSVPSPYIILLSVIIGYVFFIKGKRL